jgi:two-component system LytT family sensor kinase
VAEALTQATVFGLLAGLFCLNVGWAALRLLHRRQLPAYLAVTAAAVLLVLEAHQQVETRLHVPELIARGREAVLNPPNPWSPPRPHLLLTPEEESGGLFDTGTLLLTLMVLGLATSLAATQRAQRDAERHLELKRRQVATELSLLQAHINPHFFFNTLNNIYALTLLDGEQARAALHRLSRMMRYVLYESPAGHTRLSQESSFLRDYIELMHLRLTHQVEVVFETLDDPAAPDPYLTPMLFQPYVENAFKHGVSAIEPSRITISLAQTGAQQVTMCVCVQPLVCQSPSRYRRAGWHRPGQYPAPARFAVPWPPHVAHYRPHRPPRIRSMPQPESAAVAAPISCIAVDDEPLALVCSFIEQTLF